MPIAELEITTIAELGTALGTLILAIATFAATRSANRSARIAERSLLVGLRPTLVPSRPEDRTERVDFSLASMWRGSSREFQLPGGTAMIEQEGGETLLAIALRNIGAGMAVLQGWHLRPGMGQASDPHPDLDEFRAQRRDLYVSPDDTGFWQGAVRDTSDPVYEQVREGLESDGMFTIYLLYSDQEGAQRFISRFGLRREGDHWYPAAGRHWTLSP